MKHNDPSRGVWKATCAVCGFVYNSNELMMRWDGVYVCHKDYEPRNILDFFKVREGDISVPWTQPETNVFTNYASITDTDSPYTAVVTEEVIDVSASGGNVTINLPLANTYTFARTQQLKIVRIDSSANTVTIARQGSDLINGATSETIPINTIRIYDNDAVSNWKTF